MEVDQSQAVQAFNGNTAALNKRAAAIWGSYITVNIPIQSFDTATFMNGLGLANKDVISEEARTNNDEQLSQILAQNRIQREPFYQQRKEVEDFIAGAELSDEDRPIYGALDDPGAAKALRTYGEIQLVLKPSVMERTTLTAGDSHDLSVRGQKPGEAKVKFATKEDPYPLFTDETSGSYSEELRSGNPALVEAQVWREDQSRPVEFDKDVEKIRLSHAGLKQIAENFMMPAASKEGRYDAYGCLFDKIQFFARKHHIRFVDEHDEEWTLTAFQQELDSHRGSFNQILSLIAEMGDTKFSADQGPWKNTLGELDLR